MRGPLFPGIIVLAVALIFTPPLVQVSSAQDESAPARDGVRSVEERRVLAAIEEERVRLREKEEDLRLKEMELKTLEAEVDKKLSEFRRAGEELSALLARKNEEENKRLRELSAMYEKMEPAAAATLLSDLEENLAIGILSCMKAKKAGQVLGNMKPAKATRLSRAYSRIDGE